MPNDNTTQPVTANAKPVASTPPPILEDVVLPPMVGGEPSKSLPTDTKPVVNSGSAAPADDIVMKTEAIASTPRKKYGGGRVIATILGLFLLVGGLGAGIFLVGQNQNVNEQAAGGCKDITNAQDCNSSCSPTKSNGNSYECKWSSVNDSCGESGQVCGGGGGSATGEQITSGLCSATQQKAGWSQCGSGTGAADCTFCLNAYQRTCNEILSTRQCGTGVGSCGSITGAVEIYYCEGAGGVGSTGGDSNGCQEKDPLPAGVSWNSTNKNIVGSFCGTVQVDDADSSTLVFCSRTDTSGCSASATTPPTTPIVSAACQNVKAYSSTWSALTSTQLSALKVGNTVNFCVAGAKTGGSFTKAKFTINSVAQAETTTVRPSSTDFCQLYTIPANTTTFNVTAQIYHSTLGWK